MYTFAQRLKITAFVLMGLGFIGLAIGFASAPSTVAEAQAMVADAHGGHGDAHGSEHNTHDAHVADTHSEEKNHDAHAVTDAHDQHHGDEHADDAHADDAHADDHHGEHLLHQLQNKPWAALYVAAFFFFMIALGTLMFYAIQRAAQAGWPILLFRVMEGITAYLVPGSIIIYVFLVLTGLHANHLFVWMDAETVAHDEIIQGKVGYLNVPFFLIRAAIYLLGWNAYRYFSRKFSLAQDAASAGDISNHKKNFRISAVFLVFFFVTESMMSWDWIMSLDPHWFSTLFGWYVLASMLVTAVTVIALVTIYLKSKGFLPKVNHSHLHDLAKFMFGLSVFWTYLWFSQFMLIWYSNIPEEVTYFLTRIDDYNLPFFGMVVMNFVFPLLILMSSDYKRSNWIIVMAGIIIVLGHYIDIFNMIMPATVGDQWFIGWAEIGGFLFFAGLFIYVVFRALTKVPLEASGDPYVGESERFVY
ncbi:MAG: quinol:cytochrome C oxidoreductase [Bacteroidetes bacterium]|nr:quinol:cytochrome C oxidoreductase [Bacteroidota bacterium]